jgi:3-deoxy-D-manno-octulosonic-acid transferase
LGEFEQGSPVLEELKALYPENKMIITFFSPSGYEIRKNTPLADAVYYLPLDTEENARQFIDTIQPRMAFFTKYEYWYHYFNEVHAREIPIYMISATFRPGQIFFKWYGGFYRKILSRVYCFFLQDEESRGLLKSIGIENIIVSGDTRLDRAWATAQNPKKIPFIEDFINGHKVFIAGSTWPKDEKLVGALVKKYPGWKFIVAPHEINEERIEKLIELMPEGYKIRYSNISHLQPHPVNYWGPQMQILIIDNIGMLSSLYSYCDIAYIGGGFGAGIHNTLEAAAFDLPVIFGPKYSKFREAREFIKIKAGFSVKNKEELKKITDTLIYDRAFYDSAKKSIHTYVRENVGATKKIVDHIKKLQYYNPAAASQSK